MRRRNAHKVAYAIEDRLQFYISKALMLCDPEYDPQNVDKIRFSSELTTKDDDLIGPEVRANVYLSNRTEKTGPGFVLVLLADPLITEKDTIFYYLHSVVCI